ncbi:MAG: tRNA (N(6)-L-threonylcarbamoyladenosine(37)-C(2))-methylthiotransferase MtaB, partial [Alphaproteobacteria bacterium]|nr:tRNA (N(6)-L-threonylcarbamoyladenosine(37)-C(2))-methylthiotransferase MtaB [Alphaproteobacteria bacterium]
CGIALVHVFPYSPRPGTPAVRMPPVAPDLVRERAAQLRQAGAAALAADLAARVGTLGEVLIEKPGTGRAAFYASVAAPPELPPGSVQTMRFVAARDGGLVGEPVA